MANVLLGIHCVVAGCTNTQRKVNQWKARPCLKPGHKGKSHAQCMCPDPFQFFKFPVEVKLRKIWAERIGRPDLEVNNLTRVCSLHFPEGKPTRRNYFPKLNLRSSDKEVHESDGNEHDRRVADANETAGDVGFNDFARTKGTVSVVPLEQLQEDEEEGDEGDMPNARFHRYRQEEHATSVPPNTVTITRVKATNRGVVRTGTGNPSAGKQVQIPVSGQSGAKYARVAPNSGRGAALNQSSVPTSTSIERIQRAHHSNEDGFDSENDSEGGYMFMEDDDDSSELSDGIDVQLKRKESSTSNVSENKRKKHPDVKPKALPVFASVPSSENNGDFEPIITRVDSAATGVKSVEPSQATPATKDKDNSTNGANSTSITSETKEEDIEMVYSAIQPKPLATYDPSKQQLQIANPIKYILECHNRIAQLLAEKQTLETTNSKLQASVQKLQQENSSLKREIVAIRNRPATQLRLPTSNLVPRQTMSQLRNGSAGSTRRVRYVIRSPAPVFKSNMIKH